MELHSVILNVVGPEPGRVVQCQSSCGPTAEMALREHLQEAEREGLGEESMRIGHRDAKRRDLVMPASFPVAFQLHIPPNQPCRAT